MDRKNARRSPTAATGQQRGQNIDSSGGLSHRRAQSVRFLAFARVQRLVDAKVTALLAAEGLKDVTSQQANVLMVLFQAKRALSARAIADAMAVSEVTVGRFVKALAAAGWADRQRDPDDGRAFAIRPTKKAYRNLPRFIAVSNRLLDEAFAGFSAREIQRVGATTERILANLQEPPSCGG